MEIRDIGARLQVGYNEVTYKLVRNTVCICIASMVSSNNPINREYREGTKKGNKIHSKCRVYQQCSICNKTTSTYLTLTLTSDLSTSARALS